MREQRSEKNKLKNATRARSQSEKTELKNNSRAEREKPKKINSRTKEKR
jgi:hypothetical protein